MKFYTEIVLQMTDTIGEYLPVSEKSFDYNGPVALCDRAAQGEAKQAQKTAATQASTYGARASEERAPLDQYDRQNLDNPQGFGQQGVGEMLTAALGGAGGASASIVGEEELGAKRGTTGTNSALLDEVARTRSQAGAKASEGIAASDIALKQQQRSAAADDLSRRYGIDVNAQLGQGNLQNSEINTQIKAGQTGWFQNLMQGIATVTGGAKNVASAMYGGGSGFANS
jgi:hypothetical protein